MLIIPDSFIEEVFEQIKRESFIYRIYRGFNCPTVDRKIKFDGPPKGVFMLGVENDSGISQRFRKICDEKEISSDASRAKP